MFTVILDHGGWGAVLLYGDSKKEISGFNKNTTNNIMEITAVLEAVKMLKFPCEITIYSDRKNFIMNYKNINLNL